MVEKDEHSTSNVQHRMKKQTSTLEVTVQVIRLFTKSLQPSAYPPEKLPLDKFPVYPD
jgi:hypothetical protein